MTLLSLIADLTPSPSPSPQFDPVNVTPGWIGFVITFGVAILTVLLIIDMSRRVRRVRYRSEIREQLLVEEAENLASRTDDDDTDDDDQDPVNTRNPKE